MNSSIKRPDSFESNKRFKSEYYPNVTYQILRTNDGVDIIMKEVKTDANASPEYYAFKMTPFSFPIRRIENRYEVDVNHPVLQHATYNKPMPILKNYLEETGTTGEPFKKINRLNYETTSKNYVPRISSTITPNRTEEEEEEEEGNIKNNLNTEDVYKRNLI
ncbi:hypothetical protein [Parapoynx stagnalis nucleopolyhedrovirus]|uniref:Uncharacterized protein n=1 Tax=Parapoynx stagnalis nucleopolyhedrovirus TaxID=2993413 RepID=A0A9E7YAT7_9ABAC|nr:hypothetical protein [Parapoynx stagnalis nucleopolyhedrovirus]